MCGTESLLLVPSLGVKLSTKRRNGAVSVRVRLFLPFMVYGTTLAPDVLLMAGTWW